MQPSTNALLHRLLIAAFALLTPSLFAITPPSISFVENIGQENERVRFTVYSKSQRAYFELDGVRLLDRATGVETRLLLIDAESDVDLIATHAIGGRANFFSGQQHLSGAPMFGGVCYSNVYEGIDLVYTGDGRDLKREFHLAAGANASRIRFAFEDATSVNVAADGSITVAFDFTELIESPPIAWQIIDGAKHMIDVSFAVEADMSISFTLGEYDEHLPLVIDPTLGFLDTLSGSGDDTAFSVAYSDTHGIFLTGRTTSTDFPTKDPAQPTYAGDTGEFGDIFVARLDKDTHEVIYATYLGGSESDFGNGIGVDDDGNATISGWTSSSDFPTTAEAFQSELAGGSDGVVVKLASDGSLIYSTYFGGANDDQFSSLAIHNDPASFSRDDSIALGGFSNSEDFPIVGTRSDTTHAGDAGGTLDAVVVLLDPDGAIRWSTYLGAEGSEIVLDVSRVISGKVLAAGWTESSNISSQPFQTNRGGKDAFVTLFDSFDGRRETWTMGGSGEDIANAVVAHPWGSSFYIAGSTTSIDLTLKNPIQAEYGGGDTDAFVARFDEQQSSTRDVSYLGGSDNDAIRDLAMDGTDRLVAVGVTSSTDFPVPFAIQTDYGGGESDGFAVSFDTASQTPKSGAATFLGGSGTDGLTSLALLPGDSPRDILAAGVSTSDDLPSAQGTIAAAGAQTQALSDAELVIYVLLRALNPLIGPDLSVEIPATSPFAASNPELVPVPNSSPVKPASATYVVVRNQGVLPASGYTLCVNRTGLKPLIAEFFTPLGSVPLAIGSTEGNKTTYELPFMPPGSVIEIGLGDEVTDEDGAGLRLQVDVVAPEGDPDVNPANNTASLDYDLPINGMEIPAYGIGHKAVQPESVVTTTPDGGIAVSKPDPLIPGGFDIELEDVETFEVVLDTSPLKDAPDGSGFIITVDGPSDWLPEQTLFSIIVEKTGDNVDILYGDGSLGDSSGRATLFSDDQLVDDSSSFIAARSMSNTVMRVDGFSPEQIQLEIEMQQSREVKFSARLWDSDGNAAPVQSGDFTVDQFQFVVAPGSGEIFDPEFVRIDVFGMDSLTIRDERIRVNSVPISGFGGIHFRPRPDDGGFSAEESPLEPNGGIRSHGLGFGGIVHTSSENFVPPNSSFSSDATFGELRLEPRSTIRTEFSDQGLGIFQTVTIEGFDGQPFVVEFFVDDTPTGQLPMDGPSQSFEYFGFAELTGAGAAGSPPTVVFEFDSPTFITPSGSFDSLEANEMRIRPANSVLDQGQHLETPLRGLETRFSGRRSVDFGEPRITPEYPVINDFNPKAGEPGTRITVHGAGFGTRKDDLCAVIMDGNRSIPLTVVDLEPGTVILEIPDGWTAEGVGEGPPNPGPIMIGRGMGDRFVLPNGIRLESRRGWVWERDPIGAPAATSDDVFTPQGGAPADPNVIRFFGHSANSVDLDFTDVGGVFPPAEIIGQSSAAAVPGIGPGVEITIQARAHDHAQRKGQDLDMQAFIVENTLTVEEAGQAVCDAVVAAFAQAGIDANCNLDILSDTSVRLTLSFGLGNIDWGNFNVFFSKALDSIDFEGNQHASLGSAETTTGDDRLTISNIGSSGDDGVRVQLARPGGTSFGLDPIVIESGTKAKIRAQAFGIFNGLASGPLGTLCIGEEEDSPSDASTAVIANALAIDADFSALGADDISVKLLKSGAEVLSATVPNGGTVAVVTDQPDGLPSVSAIGSTSLSIDGSGLFVRLDRSAVVTLSNGASAECDEIRVIPAGVEGAIESFESIEITAANLTEVKILDETPLGNTISISQSGADITLQWIGEGTLEIADEIPPIWQPVSDSANPYTLQPGDIARFFRLRQ